MKRDDRSPDDYRKSVPSDQRDLVEAIRTLVREAAPDIEEGIEHGMLDYPGLANLAAQKHYVSLYVAPAALDLHRAHFAGIDSGKSCLRFRRLDQVEPKRVRALLADVLRVRARKNAKK